MSFDFVQFEQQLQSVLSNNNSQRHEAEKYYLSGVCQQPDLTLQALVHMLRFNEKVSVRFRPFLPFPDRWFLPTKTRSIRFYLPAHAFVFRPLFSCQ
jgi:hypothetical protein